MIPNITDTIVHDNRKYRCTGFMKEYTIEMARSRSRYTEGTKKYISRSIILDIIFGGLAERNSIKLMECDRSEATYICGTGVCGCVVPLEEITSIECGSMDDETKAHFIDEYESMRERDQSLLDLIEIENKLK